MTYIDTYFFLAMLGWSIFGPILCLAAGWAARGSAFDDKRGLGRHRPGSVGATLLSGPSHPALPATAPRKRAQVRGVKT
jgi:hypothetical protein